MGKFWLAIVWMSVLVSLPAQAEDDPFSPMLTLRVGEQVLKLEREDLAALPQYQLKTSTTLNNQATLWSGPLARDVLALLKVKASEGHAMSMNSWDDYHVELSTEDFARWDVIFAYQMDGVDLTVLDLGPLRVVYPRDQHKELQDSRFDHRWVWMLREVVVTP